MESTEGRILKVKLLGVLKGIAKKNEVDLHVKSEHLKLKEVLEELCREIGDEFKARVFLGNKISADILVNYEGKVFPVRGNESMPIKPGSEITIFSFVHGG